MMISHRLPTSVGHIFSLLRLYTCLHMVRHTSAALAQVLWACGAVSCPKTFIFSCNIAKVYARLSCAGKPEGQSVNKDVNGTAKRRSMTSSGEAQRDIFWYSLQSQLQPHKGFLASGSHSLYSSSGTKAMVFGRGLPGLAPLGTVAFDMITRSTCHSLNRSKPWLKKSRMRHMCWRSLTSQSCKKEITDLTCAEP